MANYKVVITEEYETFVSVPDSIKEDDLWDFLKEVNIGDLIDFSCPKYTKEEHIPISKNSKVDFVISEDAEVETALGQGV
tara:strand:- start:222 stop:461 length:240 start_codon:yes stop_codon:yes gene_type:complete